MTTTTKYTPAAIAKAIVSGAVAAVGSAAAAAGGSDLSVLEPGQWAIVLGAGLAAFGGTFATPNKDSTPATKPVDQVLDNLPVVAEQAAAAISDLERVKNAVTGTLGAAAAVLPVGPLARKLIDDARSNT